MLIENLVIYTRKPYEDSQGRNIYHAFPLPKESEQYSAQRWSGWDKGDGEALMIDFQEETGETFPKFDGLELYDLNKRGNGGRAYQVLIPMEKNSNEYLRCDLREETLLDAMLMEGIEKGGKLNGEYAFIRDGAQTKLVLVGSDDYKKHFDMAEKKKKAKKISNKDLKVGYTYATTKGVESVYLGMYYQHGKTNIDYRTSKVDKTPTAFHVFARIYSYGHYFEFKKSQSFTVESEQPLLTEEEAKKLLQEKYVEYSEKRIGECLRQIEGCYEKWYEKSVDNNARNSLYCLEQARDEIRKLSSEAFEVYRTSQTKANKSDIMYDREFFNSRVKESEKIAEKKAEGKFFFNFA